MDDSNVKNLGPLGPLFGVWEGEKGDDTALGNDRNTKVSRYREVLRFDHLGMMNNHEQTLYGLNYSTMAWRIGEPDPYHQELGYWTWEPASRQVMRCFIIPRGITILAGGTVEPGATEFQLAADLGSPTYGICSNIFLDKEFKTVRYELKITVHKDGTFSYDEDTQIQIKGRPSLFHHRDKNTLHRVK